MADIKLAYAASAAYTITLASLATSSTLVAGQEGTAIDNSSNKYLDYLVGGKITTGTTPTAGLIEVWAYGAVNDTPLYPDVLDGTDSVETFTSRDILLASMTRIATLITDATSNRTYWFGPVSLLGAFSRMAPSGSILPAHHGLFVTHNTAVNLHATGTNHALYSRGVYTTVT